MDRHLHVELVGNAEAAVDRRRRRAPILMQLQADGAGLDLLAQRLGPAGIALAQKAQVHRECVGRLQHALDVFRPRRAGGGQGAGRRAGAATHHRGHPAHHGFLDLLRADEVDVRVHRAGGDDHALGGDHFGARADDDGDARLHVRVAGLADRADALAAQADVGFHDAPVVDDQRIGNHAIDGVGGCRPVHPLRLPHAVTDRLAAAEFDFLAVAAPAIDTQGQVLLDLDDQRGVGQPQAVTDRRAEHFRIGAASDRCHQSCPWTRPRKP